MIDDVTNFYTVWNENVVDLVFVSFSDFHDHLILVPTGNN